jgi:hypothetical protein
MIQCIRLWTGEDAESHFGNGRIELEPGTHGAVLTGKVPAANVSFEETARGGTFDRYTAPVRQLGIPLSGMLDVDVPFKPSRGGL